MQLIPTARLNPYPDNPRTIDENGFELLKQSLTDFPEMLAAQPLIVSDRTGQFVVLGGNQRLAAAKELGLESLPCIVVSGWNEDMERRAVITANTHFGNEFDPQALANEIWSQYNLPEWGVNAEILEAWENALESADWDGIDRENEDRHPDNSKTDYSSKNKEIDIDALDQTMVLKLYYSEDVYNSVKERLEAINPKIENALLNLLDDAS